MLCERCNGSGNQMFLVKKKVTFTKCTGCRGVGTKTHPDTLKKEKKNKVEEINKNDYYVDSLNHYK